MKLYSQDTIYRKATKIIKAYGPHLDLEDYIKIIPQEMEMAEAVIGDKSGASKKESVIKVIHRVIDKAEVDDLDSKQLLKKLVPILIELIINGSRKYYVINRSVDHSSHSNPSDDQPGT